MPIYEYRCDQGHEFEVRQRMVDDPVTICATCEAPVQRVFSPVAVHFKGSGFYNTDYGKRKRGGSSEDGEGGKSDGGGESQKSGDNGGSSESKGSSSDGKGSGESTGSGESKGSGDSGSKSASKAGSSAS